MTTFVEPTQVDVLQDSEKQKLLKALATQIIKDKEIKPQVKHFFKDNKFLGSFYYELYQEIHRRFESGELPTLEYLSARYKMQTVDLNMSQIDIGELLKLHIMKEKAIEELLPSIADVNNIDPRKFLISLEKIQNRIIDFEDVDMVSFADTAVIKGTLEGIKSKKSNIRFKNLEAYNYLDMKLGYLVGVLAGSGSYKSNVLAKLHAELDDEAVLHFSLEESKEAFIKRMLMSLGWITSAEFETISQSKIEHFTKRLAELYPHWHFLTLDSSHSIIDVYKIEKMIKYFKTIYKDRKMVIFIDYVQLLEGDWDAKSCRINKQLKQLATRYNCLIIEGIQGNDEATKSPYPAELSHIAFVKSLKNDCDIIIGQKIITYENEPHKPILWCKTQKHRHGKPAEFKYQIDYSKKDEDLGNWFSKQAPKVIKLQKEEFADDDYDSPSALGDDYVEISDNPLEDI